MQPVVTNRPYTFVPPHKGKFWPWVLKLRLEHHLREKFCVHGTEFRNTEALTAVLGERASVLIAPNHCRMADALVIQGLSKRVGCHFYTMASSHLFRRGRLLAWAIQKVGTFSILREGVDRTAVNTAIDLLVEAQRPLVVFPEGSLSHSNDHLNTLQEGVSLMVRAAARRNAKNAGEDAPRRTVVLPVAIKYLFDGNLQETIEPILTRIEERLTWTPRHGEDLLERIYSLGHALLTLKEMEYFGAPQAGALPERLAALIDRILGPLEDAWVAPSRASKTRSVSERVKELRKALVPEMVEGALAPEETLRRERALEQIHLAQQLSLYPPDYVRSRPTIERILETVEKFEANITDEPPANGPLRAIVEVGTPIEVGSQRQRDGDGDLHLKAVEEQLRGLLEKLSEGSRVYGRP